MKKLFDEIPYLAGEHIILRELTESDADALRGLTENETAYRYLPTFLFERKYADAREVIRRMRDECFVPKESLILGVFRKEDMRFCGLAEFYGYKEALHQTCVGARLLPECWGLGTATETIALMVEYLFSQTDVEIITASTMVENQAPGHVLEKNGFIRTASAVPEDWGYEQPTIAHKWLR